MSETQDQADFVEVERYELCEEAGYHFQFDRRQFIRAFGAGIVLILPLRRLLAQQGESQTQSPRQGESGRGGFNQRPPQDIGAWIHIDEDGRLNVFTGKVEMGQNIRTSLAQAVAEELHVPVSMIRLTMADTGLTPFDMGTFGSMTTPAMAPQLRRAAAAAREVLIELAAQQLNVEPGSVHIVDARFVNHDKSKSLSFADVAKGKTLVKVIPEKIATTPATDWTIAGTSVVKVDGRDFVTGKHHYTSDLKLPGMLYGKVMRPSAFNARLISADTKTAEAMPGVTVVHDGDFIAVAASDQQTAASAVKAIAVDWKAPGQPSNAELFDLLRKPAPESGGRREGRGGGSRPVGSIADGLAAADKKLEQSYTVAYIAHAPLEPRAAVAEWKGDQLTVWTGTQRPFGVRNELAEAFRIKEEQVRVIVPDTGSGYGGKHTGECAIEAARLAKAAGKPVKLVWTREEEFTWGYFRPAGVIDVKSGVKKDGTITAWEFHNYNSGGSGIQHKYNIPNQNIQFHPSQSPLRQGSYRGLAATANHFARETHIDELAHSIEMDPLAFRLLNLKDERMRAVLEAAAKAFGWGKGPALDHGFGISCGFEKNGYVATCVEVAVDRSAARSSAKDNGDDGHRGKGSGKDDKRAAKDSDKEGSKVKIVRVVQAFDCGAVVNPSHLKNQIEGAITQAIGGALFEAIQFTNGQILNPKFSLYRVPRFSDAPLIEVVLVNRKDLPSAGAGETPIVGLAPAVGNAIFNATGVRLRSLPLVPKGLAAV
ncbi:MAG TPA: molybdopterin cofactor-binding domain-containing protein [Pyrinomonadaceae bacterium]|nr:molybdopterin cofactor-binding domain-containing protein [Pyrinomonadaceae bacterium]